MYNILYNNRVIHKDLDEESLRRVLFELAEQATDGHIDADLIDVEEI